MDRFLIYKRYFFTFLLLLVATGCRQLSPADATPTVDPVIAMQALLQATIDADTGHHFTLDEWQAGIEAGKQRWASADVNDYLITVAYFSVMNEGQSIYTVEVRDGEIVEQTETCNSFGTSSGCVIERIDIETVTVPGLFNLVESGMSNETLNFEMLEPKFDEAFGYPAAVSILPSSSINAGFWRVESFELLGEE